LCLCGRVGGTLPDCGDWVEALNEICLEVYSLKGVEIRDERDFTRKLSKKQKNDNSVINEK